MQQVVAPAGGRPRPGTGTRPSSSSSHDAHVLYTGSNMLYRSTDRGDHAGRPSAGISRAASTRPRCPSWARQSATRRSRVTTARRRFDSLTSISESPLDASVIYTGAQDGTVEVTKDGGKTWTNLTAQVLRSAGAHTYVSTVLASKLRRGSRLRDLRRPLHGRLQAVRVRERGLRTDVAIARRRTAADTRSTGFANTRATRAARPGARARRRHLERRRPDVDSAGARHESAAGAGGRRADPAARQRARRRHARPRNLDSRRRRAARAVDAGHARQATPRSRPSRPRTR